MKEIIEKMKKTNKQAKESLERRDKISVLIIATFIAAIIYIAMSVYVLI